MGVAVNLCCVDWNYIQAAARDKSMPASVVPLVSEQMLHELSDKTDGHQNKFVTWVLKHQERVLFSRNWFDVFLTERDLGRALNRDEIINPMTSEIGKALFNAPVSRFSEWLKTQRDHECIRYQDSFRAEFVKICDSFAQFIRERKESGAVYSDSKENLSESARAPGLVTGLIDRDFSGFMTPKLREFMDQGVLAPGIERWSRLIAWFCSRRSLGERGKFENNFDDAHYVLIATYAGHLASHDRRLRETANAVFPWIGLIPESTHQ